MKFGEKNVTEDRECTGGDEMEEELKKLHFTDMKSSKVKKSL